MTIQTIRLSKGYKLPSSQSSPSTTIASPQIFLHQQLVNKQPDLHQVQPLIVHIQHDYQHDNQQLQHPSNIKLFISSHFSLPTIILSQHNSIHLFFDVSKQYVLTQLQHLLLIQFVQISIVQHQNQQAALQPSKLAKLKSSHYSIYLLYGSTAKYPSPQMFIQQQYYGLNPIVLHSKHVVPSSLQVLQSSLHTLLQAKQLSLESKLYPSSQGSLPTKYLSPHFSIHKLEEASNIQPNVKHSEHIPLIHLVHQGQHSILHQQHPSNYILFESSHSSNPLTIPSPQISIQGNTVYIKQDINIYNYDSHQTRFNFHHHTILNLQLISLHIQIDINYLYYQIQMNIQQQDNSNQTKLKYHFHKSNNKMLIRHFLKMDIKYNYLNQYHNNLFDICIKIHSKFYFNLNNKINKMNLINQNIFHIYLYMINTSINIHQSNIQLCIHKNFHLILNYLILYMLNNFNWQVHCIIYIIYHMVNIIRYYSSHNNHQNKYIIHFLNILKMSIHNVYNNLLINIIYNYNDNLNNLSHHRINQVNNLRYKLFTCQTFIFIKTSKTFKRTIFTSRCSLIYKLITQTL
ncbi:unnamed protein product [Paramecium primaurelia]|uniref:Uncharacterized protein n=1 Tax=Paramecium primaurelia TaxID=5886 RepID=A0A8S1KHJ6_PARPR|nr:unnamed protein product [Paramecium primaurelia]